MSNILEHGYAFIEMDRYEEYLEIMILPYFMIFLYSVSTTNEIEKRKKNEQKLQDSLNDREVLLKEIHHRVKNNLQTITSLINMQTNYIDDEKIKSYLSDTANRIQMLGLIHKDLYQNDDFMNVGLRKYLMNIADQLSSFYSAMNENIQLLLDVDEIVLNMDMAIPFGLIVNEVVSNCFKYAFPDNRSGEISLIFKKQSDSKYKMVIRDNGIGISEDVDFDKKTGLGLRLIKLLTKQLNGTVSIVNNNGTEFHFMFQESITKK